MASGRLVLALLLCITLASMVQGRPGKSLWDMMGFQGDAPADVTEHKEEAHHDGDEKHVEPHAEKEEEHHSADETHDDHKEDHEHGDSHSQEEGHEHEESHDHEDSHSAEEGHEHEDSHSEEEDHPENTHNPYKRFFGPVPVSWNKHLKRLTATFWHDHENHHGEGHDDHIYGHCYLHPEKDYSGDQLTGLILFKQDRGYGKAHMKLEIDGFKSEHHKHGIHIHEFGDMSEGCHHVGHHYNPFHDVHGSPDAEHHGVGDLGNLAEDDHGHVSVEHDLHLVSLTGPYSVIGRSVVISANEDDLGHGHADSSTTGHSGAPIACCTIAVDDGHDWHN